jgi:hypothetical protein
MPAGFPEVWNHAPGNGLETGPKTGRWNSSLVRPMSRRPHSIPVWGFWIDGKSSSQRRVRLVKRSSWRAIARFPCALNRETMLSFSKALPRKWTFRIGAMLEKLDAASKNTPCRSWSCGKCLLFGAAANCLRSGKGSSAPRDPLQVWVRASAEGGHRNESPHPKVAACAMQDGARNAFYWISVPPFPFPSSSGAITTAAATRSPGSMCSRRTPCAFRPDSRIVVESMRMILP